MHPIWGKLKGKIKILSVVAQNSVPLPSGGSSPHNLEGGTEARAYNGGLGQSSPGLKTATE